MLAGLLYFLFVGNVFAVCFPSIVGVSVGLVVSCSTSLCSVVGVRSYSVSRRDYSARGLSGVAFNAYPDINNLAQIIDAQKISVSVFVDQLFLEVTVRYTYFNDIISMIRAVKGSGLRNSSYNSR